MQSFSNVTVVACPETETWGADVGSRIARAYKYLTSLPLAVIKRLRVNGEIIVGKKWFISRAYYKITNAGWWGVQRILDALWLIKKWGALGKPPYKYYKRIFNISRVQKYKSINADIYIGFGTSNFTAELVSLCKCTNKPIIIFVASDSDLSKDYYKGSRIRNSYDDLGDNCHFVIQSANNLVVQTPHQKDLARDCFQRSSVIIPNPIDLSIQRDPDRKRETRRYIAWVGKADKVKQPEIFVELAKRLPDLEFRMVMNSGQPKIEELVMENLPKNVTRIEKISRTDIPRFFEDAIALVNTSRFEGFPNAFIEACRAGVPIVSLCVDSGEILSRHNCGRFAGENFERLVKDLWLICEDENAWMSHHAAALMYVKTHHDQSTCIDQFIKEIEATMSEKASRQAAG